MPWKFAKTKNLELCWSTLWLTEVVDRSWGKKKPTSQLPHKECLTEFTYNCKQTKDIMMICKTTMHQIRYFALSLPSPYLVHYQNALILPTHWKNIFKRYIFNPFIFSYSTRSQGTVISHLDYCNSLLIFSLLPLLLTFKQFFPIQPELFLKPVNLNI